MADLARLAQSAWRHIEEAIDGVTHNLTALADAAARAPPANAAATIARLGARERSLRAQEHYLQRQRDTVQALAQRFASHSPHGEELTAQEYEVRSCASCWSCGRGLARAAECAAASPS